VETDYNEAPVRGQYIQSLLKHSAELFQLVINEHPDGQEASRCGVFAAFTGGYCVGDNLGKVHGADDRCCFASFHNISRNPAVEALFAELAKGTRNFFLGCTCKPLCRALSSIGVHTHVERT
jgi:hypothetical protein